MASKAVPSRSVSLYFSSPYFRPLLDILTGDTGYESHSALVSDMLLFLFVKKGLWNAKKGVPTKEAMRRSPQLRRLKAMLDLLEAKDGDSALFEGLAEEMSKERKKRTPV
jgi:hypothetical protein